jgi:hypothetical protein
MNISSPEQVIIYLIVGILLGHFFCQISISFRTIAINAFAIVMGILAYHLLRVSWG